MVGKICRCFGVGILAVLLFAGQGRAENYKIDQAHSSVDFTIKHIFSKVPGSFTNFKGMISYDPANPSGASVEATIQTASINTKNERRDNHLRSADFFDVEKYPEISFKSTGVSKKGDRLMVAGDLTMHGVTQSVVMPVEVLGVGIHPMSKGPVAGFSAQLTIKRSEFGVNSWTDAAGILSDEVWITVNVEAVGAGDGNACNPCAKKAMKNACNPCAKKAKKNACNPCAKKKNPCNPCGK